MTGLVLEQKGNDCPLDGCGSCKTELSASVDERLGESEIGKGGSGRKQVNAAVGIVLGWLCNGRFYTAFGLLRLPGSLLLGLSEEGRHGMSVVD